MISLGKSELHYYGERQYVNAIHLFECFAGLVQENFEAEKAPQFLTSLKVLSEVNNDGEWWLTDSGEKGTGDIGKATAKFDFIDSAGGKRSIIFVDDGPPVSRRKPNPSPRYSDLAVNEDFAGSAQLNGVESATDLFEGIVQSYKAVHQKTFENIDPSADDIRFIFIEKFPLLGQNPVTLQNPHVYFSHLGMRSNDDRVYTMCRITVEQCLQNDPIKLCFSFVSGANK